MEQLLHKLNKLGIKLRLDGDKLGINAPIGIMSAELRAELAQHKDKLLASLRQTGVTQTLPVITHDATARFEPFPLTALQNAYWLGRDSTMEMGGIATHYYTEFDCRGMDPARINHALCRLIERHDMLRAVVDGSGMQRVLPVVPPYRIALDDRSTAAQAEWEQAIAATRDALSHQVLQPDRWPLFEVRATLMPGAALRLHVSLDLLIFDASSIVLLLREWRQLYEQPEQEPAAPAITFRDYVLGENALHDSAAWRRARDYWLARVDSMPATPALPLRADPAARTAPRFSRRQARLEKSRWDKLKADARGRGLTPSCLLLALYAAVLARWSASPHFTLNITLSNRLPLHPDVTHLLGDFTSLIMHEVDYRDAGLGFAEQAQRVQGQFLKDLEHSRFSGVNVLQEWTKRRGMSRQAAMPVVFSSGLTQNGDDEIGNRDQLGTQVYAISQTSQVWLDQHVVERDGALVFNWDAVDAVFEEGVLDALFAAYCDLIERLCEQPGLWDSQDIVALPEAMQRRRDEVDRSSAPIPEGRLHAGFVSHALLQPQADAILSPSRTMTYGELLSESAALADDLIGRGLCPGQTVAVLMHKGWEQIVAVYGVLLAGGVYLPIDADLPAMRQAALLQIGGARHALTQPGSALDWLADAGIERIEILPGIRADFKLVHRHSLERDSGELAYVIFTSGTTGVPKGVMIDHRGAMNTVAHINRLYGIGPQDRVLALSSLSFDLSVYDIFGVLGAGGALVLPDHGKGQDPLHWRELMDEHRVSLWNSAPQLMRMLMDSFSAGETGTAPLRTVLLSGDFIPLDLPERIRACHAGAKLISLGGATEASIWSIHYPVRTVDPAWTSIPYGRALPNQTVRVLDAALRPCPDHVTGRIYIGGIGLAQGYWQDAQKTAARFITHPISGERLYNTGDLGRYATDGNVLILGRDDGQVKIRGYRIELGEIEAVLTQHPAVRQAVVLAVGDQARHRQLAAYVVLADEAPPVQELKVYLSQRLPDYMVPPHMMTLAALPLSANGKIDYRALPAIGAEADDAGPALLAPRNATEQTMLDAWSKIIPSGAIGVGDNFFELGGDSLLATQLVRAINSALPGFKLQMHELFENLTIELLAALYLQRQGTQPAADRQAASDDSPSMLADIRAAIERFAGLDFSAPAPARTRAIFLTGAGGWIGSHLLAELLSATDAQLHCLVRIQDKVDARRRLVDTMRRNGSEIDPSWPSRIVPICGDLALPDFGLNQSDWNTLAAETDAIYHFGASLNVLVDYAHLREVNVASTSTIVRLAAAHHVKPVFFASPMAVSRRYLDGRQIVLPHEATHADPAGLLSGYAKSKWAAEQILSAAAERGLPVKIYRSSHALPSSRNGAAKPNDTFATVLRTACAAGLVPEGSGAVFHGVPVDILARLIAVNALQADGYRGIVHLENRDPQKLDALIGILLDAGPGYRASLEEWKSACLQAASSLPDAAAGLARALFAQRAGGAAVDHMFNADPVDTGYVDSRGEGDRLADLTPATYWELVRRTAGW